MFSRSSLCTLCTVFAVLSGLFSVSLLHRALLCVAALRDGGDGPPLTIDRNVFITGRGPPGAGAVSLTNVDAGAELATWQLLTATAFLATGFTWATVRDAC